MAGLHTNITNSSKIPLPVSKPSGCDPAIFEQPRGSKAGASFLECARRDPIHKGRLRDFQLSSAYLHLRGRARPAFHCL
jgi:hypothetical protein